MDSKLALTATLIGIFFPTMGRDITFVLPALAVLLTLIACTRDDPMFGSSYDACILKNATKGGDDQSRETAIAICARHFTRQATPSEAALVKGNAAITFGTVGSPSSPNYVIAFDPRNSDDKIVADIRNNTPDTIVTQVVLDAYFYKGPPDASGNFNENDKISSLFWTLDTSVEPNTVDKVTGTFDGGRAPSKFYKAYYVANKVLPHTGQSNSPLRE